MDLMAAVRADEQAAAVVQPGEGTFDNPALAAESGAVPGLAPGDHRPDPPSPEQPPVLVEVVSRGRRRGARAACAADRPDPARAARGRAAPAAA
jgi:hypothetical protein